ncbi:MAG: 50S ribosomal protein L6 [Candidatus Hydrogenedentota bacterium]
MSRIAGKPIKIPQGVKVVIENDTIFVEGPKGKLKRKFRNDKIEIQKNEDNITVITIASDSETKALQGLYYRLIQGMFTGVISGYEKKLHIMGMGYKAELKGKNLVLSLGFSHPVNFEIPEGLSINIELDKEKNSIITIKGIDKELVTNTAAKIRAIKEPEPYQGKGIRLFGEYVRRKAGKAVVK